MDHMDSSWIELVKLCVSTECLVSASQGATLCLSFRRNFPDILLVEYICQESCKTPAVIKHSLKSM